MKERRATKDADQLLHAVDLADAALTSSAPRTSDGAGPVMALSFPNESRSYDSTRHAVRFWGYDSAMEASFFVTADALRHLQPDVRPGEAELLQAFDSNRALIQATAAKVYKRGTKGSYNLVPSDF